MTLVRGAVLALITMEVTALNVNLQRRLIIQISSLIVIQM